MKTIEREQGDHVSRKLQAECDRLRVHFVRMNAADLYTATQKRLATLKNEVLTLMKLMKLAKLDSEK